MSYGGRRYGGGGGGGGGGNRYRDNYQQPSPWQSSFNGPQRGYPDRYSSGARFSDSIRDPSSLDAASQLATANALLNAVLQNQERGIKRRFDSRDSYSRDRGVSYRRTSAPRRNYGRNTYSSGRPRPRRAEEKTKSGDKKEAEKIKEEKKEDKKEDGAVSGEEEESKDTGEKEDADKEKAKGDSPKKEIKLAWKYRCHLCRKSNETVREHFDHTKTSEHNDAINNQKQVYRRQTQAIVYKLRNLEELDRRRNEYGQRGFCTVCNVGFIGQASRHNNLRLHRDMRNLKAPYCRYCDMRFSDRILFDEHILTITHMEKRAKMIKEGIRPGEKKEPEESDEEEKLNFPEEYNGEQALGLQCVSKVIGYFCKICCKFFTEGEVSKEAHCKEEDHFHKFVEHATMRKEEIAKKKQEAAAAETKEDEVKENGLDESGSDIDEEEASNEGEVADHDDDDEVEADDDAAEGLDEDVDLGEDDDNPDDEETKEKSESKKKRKAADELTDGKEEGTKESLPKKKLKGDADENTEASIAEEEAEEEPVVEGDAVVEEEIEVEDEEEEEIVFKKKQKEETPKAVRGGKRSRGKRGKK